MLWALVVLLLVLWLGGLLLHVAGALIHLLLVIAVVVALIPLAAQEADWLAAAGGAAIGLLSGLALMLARRG